MNVSAYAGQHCAEKEGGKTGGVAGRSKVTEVLAFTREMVAIWTDFFLTVLTRRHVCGQMCVTLSAACGSASPPV